MTRTDWQRGCGECHAEIEEFCTAHPFAKPECFNCGPHGDFGSCPECFEATGLGCPHGDLCAMCKRASEGDGGLRNRILTLQSAIIDYAADRMPGASFLTVELIAEDREPALKIAIPGTNRDCAEVAIVCPDYDDSDTDWILCFYTRDGWRDGDDSLWGAKHCSGAIDIFYEIQKQMARR